VQGALGLLAQLTRERVGRLLRADAIQGHESGRRVAGVE
jgi:hypothetical protein